MLPAADRPPKMDMKKLSVLVLLVTPIISFPFSIAPGFVHVAKLPLCSPRTVSSFALRGLRGGFVSDIQQQIFADARREAKASRPGELTSLKTSSGTEFEKAPPAPGTYKTYRLKTFPSVRN